MEDERQRNIILYTILTATVGLLITIAGVLSFLFGDHMPFNPETDTQPLNTCVQEAKQCPDGTYVQRQGPQCDFAACPGL